MKTTRTWFMVTVIAIVALFASAGSLAAQSAAREIVFANGIGSDISQLTISPSSVQYPKDRNAFSISVQIADKSSVSVEIPKDFYRYESFDIDVISGGKNYFAKKGVKLDFSKGTPLLELNESGKTSTFPIISAAAGGATGIVLLTTTRAGKIIFYDLIWDAAYRFGPIKFGKARLLLGIPVIATIGGLLIGEAVAVRCMDIQLAYLQ